MRILATAGPAERLKFVKRIMESRSSNLGGEVVAVTASGVNDDRVLRTADVGLTMVTMQQSLFLTIGLIRHESSRVPWRV